MTLLAIDPGARSYGLALFGPCLPVGAGAGVDHWLLRAGYVNGDSAPDALQAALRWLDGLKVTLAVGEIPRSYDVQNQKGDQNDLIGVALALGRLLGAAAYSEHLVTPAEWKGQVPKKVMHQRIRNTLERDERTALDRGLSAVSPSLQHNVLDAVGIGMFHLRRLK